jgi:hypothetical protein
MTTGKEQMSIGYYGQQQLVDCIAYWVATRASRSYRGVTSAVKFKVASENGHAEVAKFTPECKANSITRNKLLFTILDIVEYGADELEDGKGEAKVSLHAAAEDGNIDTVKVIALTWNLNGYECP